MKKCLIVLCLITCQLSFADTVLDRGTVKEPQNSDITKAIKKLYAAKRTRSSSNKSDHLKEARKLLEKKSLVKTYKADLYLAGEKMFSELDDYYFSNDLWHGDKFCYKGSKSETIELINDAVDADRITGDEEWLENASSGEGDLIQLLFKDGPNEWEERMSITKC